MIKDYGLLIDEAVYRNDSIYLVGKLYKKFGFIYTFIEIHYERVDCFDHFPCAKETKYLVHKKKAMEQFKFFKEELARQKQKHGMVTSWI